jgi:hypothetical protein
MSLEEAEELLGEDMEAEDLDQQKHMPPFVHLNKRYVLVFL